MTTDRRLVWLRALSIALLAGAWVALLATAWETAEPEKLRLAVDYASPFLGAFLLTLPLAEQTRGRRRRARSLGLVLAQLGIGAFLGALLHFGLVWGLGLYKGVEVPFGASPGSVCLWGCGALFGLWMPAKADKPPSDEKGWVKKKRKKKGKKKRKR